MLISSIRRTISVDIFFFLFALISLVLFIRPTFATPLSLSKNHVENTSAKTFFVSTKGSDFNSGETWSDAFRTIQEALEMAQPGDEILIGHGHYKQDIRSVRSGSSNAPIRISGIGSVKIKGGGKGRIIQINHSHIIMNGIEVNGKISDENKPESYRDKLVYIMGENSEQGVSGVKLLNMIFKNAGGECVRLKYFAHHNEIANSKFHNCGIWDYRYNDGGKNGEAIYIGTAPEQLSKNPTFETDESNSNWVHDNTFYTQGNECIDIKEGSSYNIIERNSCTGQKDPESGGISIRGDNNIVRNNIVYNNTGAGIRIGGDMENQGINNEIVNNWLKYNDYGGMKITRIPQGMICDNTIRVSKNLKSPAAYQLDPTLSCF